MSDTSTDFVEELLAGIPERLTPLRDMVRPNEELELYSGPFTLAIGNNRYDSQGTIDFHWIPTVGIRVSGVTNRQQHLMEDYTNNTPFQVLLQGVVVGKGYFSGINMSNVSEKVSLKGQLPSGFGRGDATIPVDTIRFDVPNMGKFIGSAIKRGTGVSKARLTLEDDQYLIHIDQVAEFDKRDEQISQEGGYILTCTGSIQKKEGKISFEEGKAVARVLGFYFSFLNGRRTAPLFLTGLTGGSAVWTKNFSGRIDAYKSGFSWRPQVLRQEVSDLWKSFSGLLLKEGENDWLTTAIHWYMEANGKGGSVEGSIMIIQSALELLCNRVIVEDRKILSFNKFKPLPAADKIRLLLSTLKIDKEIPAHLSAILLDRPGVDGPEKLVEIRNALVRGQEKKRQKLKKVPPAAFLAVLNLGIVYVEVILLKLLGYRGEYYDRSIVVCYKSYDDQDI